MNIEEKLLSLADADYRRFQCALMPSVPFEKVIGVRIPEVRRIAKELYSTPQAEEFLNSLPHKTYDEDNLHASLIALEKDYDACVNQLILFLPYVDNWATCDMMSPRVLSKHPDKTLLLARKLMKSPHTYTCRFGILTLMRHFSDETFSSDFLYDVAKIPENDYYIIMMKAWYFATLLAKHYEETKLFLQKSHLSDKVIKKSIQKACESRRITQEEKAELRRIFG